MDTRGKSGGGSAVASSSMPVYFDVVLPPAYIKSGNALFFHLMPLSLPVKRKKKLNKIFYFIWKKRGERRTVKGRCVPFIFFSPLLFAAGKPTSEEHNSAYKTRLGGI